MECRGKTTHVVQEPAGGGGGGGGRERGHTASALLPPTRARCALLNPPQLLHDARPDQDPEHLMARLSQEEQRALGLYVSDCPGQGVQALGDNQSSGGRHGAWGAHGGMAEGCTCGVHEP